MQRNAPGWTSALDDLDRALSGKPARRGAEVDPPDRRARASRGGRAGRGEAERDAGTDRRRTR